MKDSAPMKRTRSTITFVLLSFALTGFVTAQAGEADVTHVGITALGDNSYRIDTTVLHADAGWDHYANRWDVLTEDGALLGSRVLAHPHENEQPFTRSTTLTIPDDVMEITIQAHDSVHELGGATITVAVPH
ncbi:MAG: hypothetical protein V3U76_10500 [Granulosicoccus sp.]